MENLSFVALGGGSEVGRSCHIISYKGKTIMLDAGVHPAYSGIASLPFYDEFDLSTVDILLVSHFHLDHAASLPYVMCHTDFKGRVFMTHPTKAIYRWLLSDFVRVSTAGDDSNAELYTDEDLNNSFDRIEAVDFGSTISVEGIRFTAHYAGHVLGAAMYLIELGGVKVLFTGDYSREQNRHLHSATPPSVKPDILICESTYGTGVHQPRPEKEQRLTSLIHSTILKGGRCLLPVFALGSAQELLLILDEYWDKHPELETVSIYYASSLARKCMAVFQTFVHMMNERIQQKMSTAKVNPFHFKHVKSIRNLDMFSDIGPCVMLASPGMLQNGVSRQLLERWAPDSRNSLIVTGYSVQGTLAKQILNEPMDFPSLANPDVRIPRRMSVEELSFAAHVDFNENTDFIDAVDAPHVILVHGETHNMGRLKSALLSRYSSRRNTPKEMKIYNPRNCVEVLVPCKLVKVAQTAGHLALQTPNQGTSVSGVLVQKDFCLRLVTVSDLREYTGLTTCTVMEKQTLVVDAGPELVRYHLLAMFGEIKDVGPNEWQVMDAVSISANENKYSVEWSASVGNDAIADTVVAVLLGVDSSKASVKLSSRPCGHSLHAPQARTKQILEVVRSQFGDTFSLDENKDSGTIVIDGLEAKIQLSDFSVECTNPALRQRIEHVLMLGANLAAPLAV